MTTSLTLTDAEKDSLARHYHTQLLDNARLMRSRKISRAEHDMVLNYTWELAHEHRIYGRLMALFMANEDAQAVLS